MCLNFDDQFINHNAVCNFKCYQQFVNKYLCKDSIIRYIVLESSITIKTYMTTSLNDMQFFGGVLEPYEGFLSKNAADLL